MLIMLHCIRGSVAGPAYFTPESVQVAEYPSDVYFHIFTVTC